MNPSTITQSAGPFQADRWATRPADSVAEEANSRSETAATPPDVINDMLGDLEELREYSSFFIATQIDRFKLLAFNSMIGAALAVLLIFTACTFIFTGSLLLSFGAAQAISALCGGSLWLGCLLTGALMLSSIAIGAGILVMRLKAISRERTRQRYEQRKSEQLARFGRNVESPQ